MNLKMKMETAQIQIRRQPKLLDLRCARHQAALSRLPTEQWGRLGATGRRHRLHHLQDPAEQRGAQHTEFQYGVPPRPTCDVTAGHSC